MPRKKKLTILLSGMIAADPWQGGATWALLQYLLGFRRLGHEVWFVEPVPPASLRPPSSTLEASENAKYFRHVADAFDIGQRSALLLAGTRETVGASYDALRKVAARCDVLVNVAGMLCDESVSERIPHRVYLDLDPAFVQMWHAVQGIDMRFAGHTHFVTVGLSIGTPQCSVPTCGLDWIPTPQPIVLEHWPVAGSTGNGSLTTIGNWRGYGSIHHAGVHYGQKAHSIREFIDLPLRCTRPVMPAFAIHPGESADLAALAANRWQVVDPATVADTPAHYRQFIQDSWAELGVAKSGYVASRCGWFSDRSVCYLASGRPVIAQSTGFASSLPTGNGLLCFETTHQALAAIEAVNADYPSHARAARGVAVEFFESDKVLSKLLDAVGATS